MDHYQRELDRGLSPDEIARVLAASEEAARLLLRSSALRTLCQLSWAASNETRAPGRQLYFLHIMKTGGTALSHFLHRLAGAEFVLTDLLLDQLVTLPRPLLQRARLIAGHLSYEALELLPPDAAVCTVIRHPVERTLSHYWQLRRDPAFMAEVPDFSLEVFLESPRWRTLATNYQARHLVHRIGIADAWVGFSPPERFARLGPPFPETHELPLQSLFDCTPLPLTEAQLTKVALARLDGIDFVGVTERLDDLLASLASFFGAPVPPYLARENVGAGRPRADDLPDSVLERIRAMNRADLALHEAARRRVLQGNGEKGREECQGTDGPAGARGRGRSAAAS